jgi:hypothetical protein
MRSTLTVAGRGAAAIIVTAMLAVTMLGLPSAAGAPTPVPSASVSASPQAAVPLLAFYYIWFDPASWDRAKIDYPRLGRYSSDDPRVMRQHIEWAKSAGIEGFIVSWKDTTTNDRRLQLLMGVAREMNFKLAVIYQGLDFSRNPLPVTQVAADFLTFSKEYATDPVFLRLGGKPLTIWSGTWAYTHDQVAQVTGPVRDSMLVLNTEKNTKGYQRISDVTDGDAYYWSSVNTDTNTGYGAKLSDMSQAIHQDGKYWIAPFAPGFDARKVGGTSTVDRKDGQTLRIQYATALQSSPDALGLISWNEFSENSYVEPSEKFGTRYLDVLRELRATPVPQPPSATDSSGEAGPGGAGANDVWRRWPGVLLLGSPVLLVVVVALLARRQRRRGSTTHAGPVAAVPSTEVSSAGRTGDRLAE